MSDMIDAFKALKAMRQEERDDGWASREEHWGKPLREAGFTPFTVHEAGRHCRVRFVGGWFDFWPSSGKWMSSPLKGARRPLRGRGVESLIEALTKVSAP